MVDVPYIVHTTKNEVDQNLLGVCQEDLELSLKYSGISDNGWTVESGGVRRGRVCH